MKHESLFKKLALLSALATSVALHAAEGTLPIPMEMYGNAGRVVNDIDGPLELTIDRAQLRAAAGAGATAPCRSNEAAYTASGNITHQLKDFRINSFCLSGNMDRGSLRIFGANAVQTVELKGNLSSTPDSLSSSFTGDMVIATAPGVPSGSPESSAAPVLLKFQLRMPK